MSRRGGVHQLAIELSIRPMANPWLFILAVLTVLATPGPTNTLLATGSAVAGLRTSLPLVLAELLGYLVTVNVVGLLLRPVLVAEPAIGIALKLAVALYLAYSAVRLWRRTRHGESSVNPVAWRQVFIATLLNPKGLIFAFAIVPFGNPEVAFYLVVFSVAVLVMGMAWLTAGHFVGAMAGENRRLVPRIASIALVGFAGLIAASAFG